MKRIVITGSTGAIGIALIAQCIQQNVEVYALCRRGSKRRKRIPEHPLVHVVECNLEEMCNYPIVDMPTMDVFYHLGWDATIGDGRNDMYLQLKNVKHTLDAVDLAARLGCRAFIGAGSQAEYGRFEGRLNGQVPTLPENGYGIAKLCAGQMSRVQCQKQGMKHIWTRILSVYGPNDSEKTMISTTIQKLLNGERPLLTKGEQLWDYLYCGDAARALFLLGEKGKTNKIYCIGSGKAIPLIEYIQILRDKINPKAELGIGAIPYGTKQVMHLCADISELTMDTGFLPKISFDEGIEKTIQWMKSRK